MKPNLCRIHALEDDTSDSLMHQDREYLTRVTEIYKEGKGPLACNFIDAGIKYRPTEKEVEEMGEEFKRVWEEDFRDKPDKALMWIGISMM
jgi:alcohol oxidase